MRNLNILAFLAATAVFAHPALAADQCARLTLITSADMHIGNDGRIYVPVAINGASKSMLVDTGGFFTEMSQSVADELKLPTRHVGLVLVGVMGQTTQIATRTSFKLGNLSTDSMDYMVSPLEKEFASDIPDAAGILAPNLLRAYDVDLDMGSRKFNLISQDHCDGQVVYWSAPAVAVVPMHLNSNGHVIVPVTVDGQTLNALLDTGASGTVINLGTAELELGLKPGSPDTPATRYMSDTSSVAVYHHQFKSLTFAGITVANPDMELIPDLMGPQLPNPAASLEHDTRIPDKSLEIALPQVIIGMNVLHRLHIYIAYKEQKLYISPANTPAASSGSATAADAPH